MSIEIINIADLKDPDDSAGRSYRQVNAEKVHNIQIGSLVEVESNGVRMFVVCHGRDCDQTPLYYLSSDKDDVVQHNPSFRNTGWDGGYAEDSLVIIKLP